MPHQKWNREQIAVCKMMPNNVENAIAGRADLLCQNFFFCQRLNNKETHNCNRFILNEIFTSDFYIEEFQKNLS